MALAKVTDILGEFCLGPINLKIHIFDVLETGHHQSILPKTITSPFHHLATDTAVHIALDDDPASFRMGSNMDIGIAFDDQFTAVHEGADIGSDIALHPYDAPLHPSPVATVGSAKVVAGIALDE